MASCVEAQNLLHQSLQDSEQNNSRAEPRSLKQKRAGPEELWGRVLSQQQRHRLKLNGEAESHQDNLPRA
ncbi:hypothetical protein AV530_013693 [Patagioenas fasciata monilis]|uniref:Uncharacterized protein n=1 Tax=Patagioenas fasciata monilis TaxID=372326 RepID=A0A1V4J8S4_PATFA|nr:hypothetical protein AV530_013693 [Patagioenas fasciata monilis]